ncbi:hypothetical protein BHM03_00022637 [Ensete ventricosum]|nr:hypothetical protein BHM03_00022637 [Ensete ventricosum]
MPRSASITSRPRSADASPRALHGRLTDMEAFDRPPSLLLFLLLLVSSLAHALSDAEAASVARRQLLASPTKGGDLPDDFEFDVKVDVPISNPGLRRAYIALQAWLRAMYSDPSNFTGNWVGPDVCGYNGVFCSHALDDPAVSVVAGVDLNGADIAGHLPSFSRLVHLHELDVSNNRFVGPFPMVVVCLPSLTYVDLRFNDFEGALPPELFDKELDAIFLNDNLFSSHIPDNFGNSTASVVVLANNKLGGARLDGKSPRVRLGRSAARVVELGVRKKRCLGSGRPLSPARRSGYEAFVPEVLTVSVAYHVVVLRRSLRGPCGEARVVLPASGECRPCSPYPCQVSRMTTDPPMLLSGWLQSRWAGHVVGPAVRGRGDVTAKSTSVVLGAMLNELILSNNGLVGCLPTEIGLLGNATVFDASWNSLMGMLPTSFAGLSKADQLDLSHNVLTGVVPKKLCELPSLDNFTFSYNYFTARTTVAPAKRCLPVASRPVDCSREKCGSSPSSHPPNPTRKPVTPSSPAPSPKTVTPSPVPRPVHSSPPPPTSPPPASVFPPPPPDFDILPPVGGLSYASPPPPIYKGY